MNRRPTLFLATATALSALLAIGSQIGALPAALAFVFKPLTTLLVIARATQGDGAAGESAHLRRWVLAGLALSLVGDVALLWPREGFLPGLIAFLLAHLAYIAAFRVPVAFAARPGLFAVYGLVAAAVLSGLWGGVPGALRWPVLAYVACLASMAAQAAVWWRVSAAERRPDVARARLAAAGGMLFMLSDSLLAINRFAQPLVLSSLWILASYWLAQWAIASALPRRGR